MGRTFRYYLPEILWFGGAMLIVALVIFVGNGILRWEFMENYVFSLPLLWMILPPSCANALRIHTDLALGFGAARRHCYWAQQISLVLFCLEGLAATQLLYLLLQRSGYGNTHSIFSTANLRMNLSVSLWLLLCSLMVSAVTAVALRLEKRVWKGVLYTLAILFGTASYLLVLFQYSDLPLGNLYPLRLDRPGWGIGFAVMAVIWGAAVLFNRFQMDKAVVRL